MIDFPNVGDILIYRGGPDPFEVQVLRIYNNLGYCDSVKVKRLRDGVVSCCHHRNLERLEPVEDGEIHNRSVLVPIEMGL